MEIWFLFSLKNKNLPCFHSSETSPRPPPPELHDNPAHTDGHWPSGILESVENRRRYFKITENDMSVLHKAQITQLNWLLHLINVFIMRDYHCVYVYKVFTSL